MSILQKTIQSLTKEEIINYKLYANRTRKNHERKDIILFDSLKKEGINDANETDLITKIYTQNINKNTYHRLKSRLLMEIDTSTVQFYFHKTDTHYIYNELGLYKTYIQKNEWAIALYHLKKAEIKAIEIFDYALLDNIYTEFISLSVNYGDFTPNTYIQKRKENQLQLSSLRELDDALACTIYDLKRSQNFSKTHPEKLIILDAAIKNANAKKTTKHNVIFKSKLYSAISNLLLIQQDFIALEQYGIKTFKDFTTHQLFSKQNHDMKLQLLKYICNTLFMNKKYSIALEYIEKLKLGMNEFNGLLYDAYVFFYYNSLANNYSVLDSEKAIEVLNEAKTIPAIKNHHTHLGYIYLNLTGAYFDLKEYKQGLKSIINLYKHTVFGSLGEGFRLNIKITELILRIATKDVEYSLRLIKDVLKEYKNVLHASNHKQDLDFLKLMGLLLEKHHFEVTKKTTVLVNVFLKTTYKDAAIGIINYKNWLTEKFVTELVD